jgi:hypothetical protein
VGQNHASPQKNIFELLISFKYILNKVFVSKFFEASLKILMKLGGGKLSLTWHSLINETKV